MLEQAVYSLKIDSRHVKGYKSEEKSTQIWNLFQIKNWTRFCSILLLVSRLELRPSLDLSLGDYLVNQMDPRCKADEADWLADKTYSASYLG